MKCAVAFGALFASLVGRDLARPLADLRQLELLMPAGCERQAQACVLWPLQCGIRGQDGLCVLAGGREDLLVPGKVRERQEWQTRLARTDKIAWPTDLEVSF
jgi:hypothetical protein